MRVPLQPTRIAGSGGYLTGSWREATPCFIVMLINIRGGNNEILAYCSCIEVTWKQTFKCPGAENGCSVRDLVRIGSCRAEDKL